MSDPWISFFVMLLCVAGIAAWVIQYGVSLRDFTHPDNDLTDRLIQKLASDGLKQGYLTVFIGDYEIWTANAPYADMEIHNRGGIRIYGIGNRARLREAIRAAQLEEPKE